MRIVEMLLIVSVVFGMGLVVLNMPLMDIATMVRALDGMPALR